MGIGGRGGGLVCKGIEDATKQRPIEREIHTVFGNTQVSDVNKDIKCGDGGRGDFNSP